MKDACVNVDIVFHVAARAGLYGDRRVFFEANVVGTTNVIEACKARGVPKLVYTSSPSVVFDDKPHEGVDETYPYPAKYKSPYPETKATGERLVLAANSSELLTCALRPHLVWGPRDNHLLPAIVAAARTGRLVRVGSGDNLVDFSYVEDVARAHLLAADSLSHGSTVAGSAYFITQDSPVNLWEFVDGLLASLGVPPVRRRVPLGVARSIGGALELIHWLFRLPGEPRLTRFLASELALSHYYDISKAKRDFGFVPTTSMQEAMERTLPDLAARMAAM